MISSKYLVSTSYDQPLRNIWSWSRITYQRRKAFLLFIFTRFEKLIVTSFFIAKGSYHYVWSLETIFLYFYFGGHKTTIWAARINDIKSLRRSTSRDYCHIPTKLTEVGDSTKIYKIMYVIPLQMFFFGNQKQKYGENLLSK